MTGRRGLGLFGALLACGLVAGPVGPAAAETSSVLPGHVLFYGPALARGAGFNEATVARNLGYDVAIADSIAWNALTRADFARYDAVVIGDAGCSENGPGYLNLATATRSRWTPAISGNVAVLATDPVYHVRRDGLAGARRLVRNGLLQATAGARTGAFLSLGCAYAFANAFTPVPFLRGFGPFTVRGQDVAPFDGCPDTARIVRPTDPLVAGLTDGSLSGWGCAIHGGIDSFPYPFRVVARDRPTGLPYLLTRGPAAATTSGRTTVYAVPSSLRDVTPRHLATPNG